MARVNGPDSKVRDLWVEDDGGGGGPLDVVVLAILVPPGLAQCYSVWFQNEPSSERCELCGIRG